jgi:glucose/arabinose dehydrogenase
MRLVTVVVLLVTAVAAADTGDVVRIALEAVVTRGLSNPVFVTHAADRRGRLFVVEQPGRVRIVAGGTLAAMPFLDISPRVLAGGERGLLGLAFHPDYARNGRYFVNYTRRPDGATVIAEYRVSTDSGVSARDERVLLVVEQPYANHNGGMIAFGADGLLYIGMGDGGAGGDPQNRAQNPQELLGKMLRIDVNGGTPYAIPPDNPFVRGGGRPEIWALGLRNPWRFSFDRQTRELYAGDVGQHAWEEIDVVRRGGNYGWRLMEGAHCYKPARCDGQGLELPVAEYANASGRCSVTGGYVYRGTGMPALAGTYVYGDFCSGEVFALRDGRQRVLLATRLAISSFGEDEAGEIYVVDHRGGGVYRLIAGAAGR